MGTTPNPKARAATPRTEAETARAGRDAARVERADARSLRRWGIFLAIAGAVLAVVVAGLLLGWFGGGESSARPGSSRHSLTPGAGFGEASPVPNRNGGRELVRDALGVGTGRGQLLSGEVGAQPWASHPISSPGPRRRRPTPKPRRWRGRRRPPPRKPWAPPSGAAAG